MLSDADAELVDRLAVGTADSAARVLGYLLLRDRDSRFTDEPATRLAVQVGTGLNRDAVSGAMADLEARGLATETTVRTDGRGRPPKAWRSGHDVEEAVARVHDTHGERLLEHASTVGERLGTVTERSTTVTGAGEEGDRGSTVVVGLNWHPNVLQAPLFAAVEAGEYGQRGVEVRFEQFEGSGRAVEGLLAGTVDVAITGAVTAVRERAAGAPLVPLALLFQRAMTVVYTTRSVFGGPLEDVEQLRGRRVGTPAGSETGLLARLFLSQTGWFEDVTVVETEGEEREALRAGRVDAVTGTFTDPRELAADGSTVDAIPLADHYPIYGPALVTTASVLRDRREALSAFLAGTTAGRAVAATDAERAVRAVGVHDDRAVEREVRNVADAIDTFDRNNAVRDHGWGWHRVEEWERLATALDQTDLLHPT